MKRQLTELTEENVSIEAKAPGKPRIIEVDGEVYYYRDRYLREQMILTKIMRKAPRNANAFSRGVFRAKTAEYLLPIQYYRLGQGERKWTY